MESIIVSYAAKVGMLSSGFFLLIGMLTGVWKYAQIHMSENSKSHPYVDIAHRSSLLYAAACMTLAGLSLLSDWTDRINLYLVISNVVFYFFAVVSYILHGLLRDTDNQFEQPHRLGRAHMPPALVTTFMILLIVAEVGATFGLFVGAILGVMT